MLLEKIRRNLQRRLTYKPVIFDYHKDCSFKRGHALLYFKTEPLTNKILAQQYEHTNNWEILEIVRILNRFGYWVDVVDRDFDPAKFTPSDKYELFIGLGAGNSGRHYSYLASKLSRATKILFAAGPDPDYSNELILRRYLYLEERSGAKLALKRMIDKVNMNEFMKYTDVIFAVANQFSINSYEKYRKPIFPILPSTSPALSADRKQLFGRNKKKFLYFGGHGNVVKGFDLLIEVFKDMPDLTLYACAPKTETDFNDLYRKALEASKNIHFIGFIGVGGKLFNQITAECGFVILPSCSEGIATSGVTCMRRGLIPIATYEAGIDLGDFGFQIRDIRINALSALVKEISEISDIEFQEKSMKAYLNSSRYTQESFTKNIELAISSVLKQKNLFTEK